MARAASATTATTPTTMRSLAASSRLGAIVADNDIRPPGSREHCIQGDVTAPLASDGPEPHGRAAKGACSVNGLLTYLTAGRLSHHTARPGDDLTRSGRAHYVAGVVSVR